MRLTAPPASKSTRSSSNSKRDRKAFRLRLFKREFDFQELGPEHRKWLWAAYRMDHFPIIPVGLEQNEAFGWMLDLLDRFDERFMVMRDDRAVGIIALLGAPPHHELHYVPFRWATDRNVLEAAVSFIDQHRRAGRWSMMYCERGGKDHAFLTTLERTGIVRRTGTLLYHPTGPKATFEVKMLGESHVA